MYLLFFFGFLIAQKEGGLLISGKVIDYDNKPVEGATIKVIQNKTLYYQTTTEKNGKFEFDLPLGYDYTLEFSKTNYITKKILIKATTIPSDKLNAIFEFSGFTVQIYERIEGVDYSILNQPIGIIEYSPGTRNLEYDEDYTKSIQQKLKEMEELAIKKLKYKDAIKNADQLYEKKQYELALASYQIASEIMPNESYPKERISEIQGILGKEKQYSLLISQADKQFKNKNYQEAKNYYLEALNLKPNESYPKQKIAEIDKILSEQTTLTEKEKLYREYIVNADANFQSKNYLKAKDYYTKALQIKPNEQYPQKQLAKIEELIKSEEYNKSIKIADSLFNNKKYQDAKSKYQEALSIKPQEQYPKQRIAEIDAILAKERELAEKEAKYNQIIKDADALFNNKKYQDAKSKYQEALSIKPQEQYPKQRIAEIDAILAKERELAEKEAKYNQIIKDADNLFKEEKYEESKAKYTEALKIKPQEQYPKIKIAEIDALLAKKAQLLEKEKQYTKLIQEADNYFNAKKYTEAKITYVKASNIKPEEEYPKKRIAEIDAILADIREKETKYKEYIKKGDDAFNSRAWEISLNNYKLALQFKPEDPYAKSQIAKIENILKQGSSAQVQKPPKEEPSQNIQAKKTIDSLLARKMEKRQLTEFKNELARKYPPGVTTETYSDGSREIIRKIVVLGNTGSEYIKVIHGWGGTFFFRDGEPVSESLWMSETNEENVKKKLAEIENKNK